MLKNTIYFLLIIWCVALMERTQAQKSLSALEIVQKADDRMRGKTSQSEMTMSVIRPTWTRSFSMKSWSKGRDYSLILITAPAKEKGQVFLKRKDDMWNWLPAIDRLVKIPPSMMMQSWMGSDFTNDDLLKESSIVVDYQHELLGSETIRGFECHKIGLTPLPDAAVVWGKIILWIEKQEFNQIKVEFYDEDGELVNVENLSEIKDTGDRNIPTRMEIIPVDEEGHKTILKIESIIYDKPIPDRFFSQQNMQRVR